MFAHTTLQFFPQPIRDARVPYLVFVVLDIEGDLLDHFELLAHRQELLLRGPLRQLLSRTLVGFLFLLQQLHVLAV